jgi:hypothetical protein
MAVFDVRGWSHRFAAGSVPARYQAQIVMLTTLMANAPDEPKERYWDWLDATLLNRTKEEDRAVYASIIDQVRSWADETAGYSEGDNNGG